MSEELAGHSGNDDPVGDWFGEMFGKWKALVGSVLISLIAAVAFVCVAVDAFPVSDTSS